MPVTRTGRTVACRRTVRPVRVHRRRAARRSYTIPPALLALLLISILASVTIGYAAAWEAGFDAGVSYAQR